jgi:heptosyltransferase-2
LQKSEPAADQIRRIVVRGTNWVGDAVITVPALRALRNLFPDAHITIVSRPGTADVFVEADFVDEVLVYERSGLGAVWNQIREWRKRQFDLAVLFQNAFEAAALPFLARVPRRTSRNAPDQPSSFA